MFCATHYSAKRRLAIAMCRQSVHLYKALSTLSQKSATVAENSETTAKFGDCRTFLRQCGQGFNVGGLWSHRLEILETNIARTISPTPSL